MTAMITNETLLMACIASPFALAALTVLFHRVPAVRDGLNLLTPFVAPAALLLLAGGPAALQLTQIVPGAGIAFEPEPVGLVFAGLVCVLWPVSMLYSLAYLYQNRAVRMTSFLVYYNLSIGCALAVAFAGNLLTLFIFYEVLTLCTYPLVTHDRSREALAAGRVYLAVLVGSSTLLLLAAMVWIYLAAGTLDFVPGGILDGRIGDEQVKWLLLLVVFGASKAAVMPLHGWLPRAMVAPVPVSALLHAVAVVKAGVFAIVKIILYVFGVDLLAGAGAGDWLVYIASFTIIAASVVALRQTSLKKLLAYSTVSQLSYILLGAALLKPAALLGAVLHLLAHGFGKITLFFAAGAIQTASGKTRLDEMRGIGRAMPWTMGLFTVAALVIVGLPPLAGFSSKWFLLEGSVAGGGYLPAAVLVAGSALSAAYLAPVIYRAFFMAEAPAVADVRPPAERREAPTAMLIAMLLPALMCAVLFFAVDAVTAFTAAVPGFSAADAGGAP